MTRERSIQNFRMMYNWMADHAEELLSYTADLTYDEFYGAKKYTYYKLHKEGVLEELAYAKSDLYCYLCEYVNDHHYYLDDDMNLCYQCPILFCDKQNICTDYCLRISFFLSYKRKHGTIPPAAAKFLSRLLRAVAALPEKQY